MNKFLSKTKEFIFAQQTSILSSSLLLSGMIIISRLAGFIRYRVLAGFYTTEQLDIFFAAFRIPDLIFEILITGALATTFIPFFIKYQRDKEEQSEVISSIINIITLALIVFIIILALLLPYIINIITPGFSAQKTQQIVYFSQILLIGQLPFLAFGNFLTGISQAKKSFFLPAIAPVFYNFAIILTTLFFHTHLQLLSPVLGVVLGAILFLVIQLPILSFSDFKYKFVISHVKETAKFFRVAVPRIFSIIVAQVDATIDLSLATLLGSGAYTVFYLAQHLQLLPVSIIGIAYGQASLPYLSEVYQEKKYEEFKKIIVESILNVFFLTIPFASFFIFARTPIVRLFFGGQKFDWESTVATAVTLSYFSFSLPFHSIYYFITRCLYAIFDTKSPFMIGLLCVALNAVLSLMFILIFHFPVWSMAISFSFSMTLNVILLMVILHKKIGGFPVKFLVYETIKIVVATFNASLISYFTLRLLDGLIFDTSRTINVFLLLSICGTVYLSLYLFLAWLFGVKEMYLLTRMLLKVREYQKKVLEVYTGGIG